LLRRTFQRSVILFSFFNTQMTLMKRIHTDYSATQNLDLT